MQSQLTDGQTVPQTKLKTFRGNQPINGFNKCVLNSECCYRLVYNFLLEEVIFLKTSGNTKFGYFSRSNLGLAFKNAALY